MNTEVQKGNISLRNVFETIDLFKYGAIEGESVEIIVSPYEEDEKYDDSKRVVTIGLRGGFSRDRETFVFNNGEEFDALILPQILAYFESEDKMGKWEVTEPGIEGAAIKGVSETESGNLVFVAAFNKALYEELDKKKEQTEETTKYKKTELTDEEKAWRGILSYVKGRSEKIDFSGYSLTDEEVSELYRLVELIANEELTGEKIVFTSKADVTAQNIANLLKNPVLLQNNFSAEFLEKISKTVSLDVLTKLVINEKRFDNKFDRENPIVLAKVDFARVQLGGMKSNYFGSRNHREVIEKLKEEYLSSDSYTPEEKERYIKYCDEILGFIDKTKRNRDKVEETTVDLDAPLDATREEQLIVDDYDKLIEAVDLMRLGKKDEEHYEFIVEPTPGDPTKRNVRITLMDGVSKLDSYSFMFTNGEMLDTRLREILDRIFKDDPNFETVVQFVNIPGEETKKHSLRYTRDGNEILIKDAKDGLDFDRTKVVVGPSPKSPNAPSMSGAAAEEHEEEKENGEVNIFVGAKDQANRLVLSEGAKDQANRLVLSDAAKEQARRLLIEEASKDQANRLVLTELSRTPQQNNPEPTPTPNKEDKLNEFLRILNTIIEEKENRKIEDNIEKFERLHEYTKKYKISNSNGPLEIFNKETGEKYEPSTEEEKRDIEFAYYWGVMVGKNDKNNTEVINMDYAFSENNKKLFDIMDVHFKESLRKGIDIDFDSLERQFTTSGVENAEEIYNSLFKTDTLNDYVTKYYKESLGLDDDREKTIEKKSNVEYAEYRKLFDLNSSRRLTKNGQSRLNNLKNQKGPIEDMERANLEVFNALYNKIIGAEDADEKYREKQEEYNRLKRHYDEEYADDINNFKVSDGMMLDKVDIGFYEIIDAAKDKDGMTLNLTQDSKDLLEYMELDRASQSRPLSEKEESRMIELVQTNDRARILEYAKSLVNIDAIKTIDLLSVQAIYRDRLNEEIKNAKWIPKKENMNMEPGSGAPGRDPSTEAPVINPEEKNNDKAKRLSLSKDDRDFADYLKLYTIRKMRPLSEEDDKKLATLVAGNERSRVIEHAWLEVKHNRMSEEAFLEIYDTYRAQLAEAIKNAQLVEVTEEKKEEPTKEEPKKEEEVTPELMPYYEKVKAFKDNLVKYSTEKENGVTRYYDRNTNIEYTPQTKKEAAMLEFGNHWFNSVSTDNLVDNAKMYKLVDNYYMSSYGKDAPGLDYLKEEFANSGIENATTYFDNLYKDNKENFIKDKIGDINVLSENEKENGVVPDDFEHMRDLVSEYDDNKKPEDLKDQYELSVGQNFERNFGDHSNEQKTDLKIFNNETLLQRLKRFLQRIKERLLSGLGIRRNDILDSTNDFEFDSNMMQLDSDIDSLNNFITTKYSISEPIEEKTQTQEQVLEQSVEEPVPEQPAEEQAPEQPTEEPVPEQPTEEPVPEQPVEEQVPEQPAEEPVPEQPVEEQVPEQPAEEQAPEQPKVMTTEEALEELSEYMDMTYDFNAGRNVPTSVRVHFANGNKDEGEVVFSTGSGEEEMTLFHHTFTTEEIKTTVLPLITNKYVTLNDTVEKFPAYEVQGRTNNELFYVGSKSENLLQISNASEEILTQAEALMSAELSNKQEHNQGKTM